MRHHAAGGSRASWLAVDPLKSRRHFLGGLAIGVVAMSATGLATVALIETPQQVAARSAAPPLSVITGVARWGVLRNAITTQGVVRAPRTIEVTASAPFAMLTVTRMPVKLGDRVRPYRVIAEIDGRPVLLLRGRLPAYRDLHQGDSGPDVSQLQANLRHLGFADFDPSGFFGPSTSLALGLYYSHLGYRAPVYHPPGRHHKSGVPDVYLPKSEVSYIPGRSALVVAVTARVGMTVPSGAPVVSLATGSPYVTGRLTAHQASMARNGLPAQIASASPPLTTAGVVTRIGSMPSSAVTGFGVQVKPRRILPQRLIGTRVRLTLFAPVTAEPVLSVPLAAVFGKAHGQPAYVVTVSATGQHQRVPVFLGPRADGLVAVQSVQAGRLRPGDRVVIGLGR
jgi:hypothetical protein